MTAISILGAGKMGVAVAYGLLKLGNRVTLVDKSPQSLEIASKTLEPFYKLGEIPKVEYILGDVTDTTPYLVVSCLPYHQNLELAKYCLINKIGYCDLGGSVEIENLIKEECEKNFVRVPMMLSLGLAPGLVNMMVESLIQKHGIPTSVFMYVGGLPENLTWYDNRDYCVNWSVDGLLNEYKSQVEILSNGKLKIVNALDGYEEIKSGYEAFYTSGGMSHTLSDLLEKGVQNCSYRTIRYRGHLSKLKTLLNSGLSDEQIKKCLCNLYPFNPSDKVLIQITLDLKESIGNSLVKFNKTIYSDYRFTAMQKSTGYSAAAIIDYLVKIDPLDIYEPLTYKDIPLDIFFKNLNQLGL